MHVGQMQRFFLTRRRRQHALGNILVIFAAEPVAAHIGEVGVAQDDEGPGAHRRAGFEPFLSRPRLEKGFLHQIVCHVGAPAQAARERAKMRNALCQFPFEIGLFRDRACVRPHQFLVSSCDSRSLN